MQGNSIPKRQPTVVGVDCYSHTKLKRGRNPRTAATICEVQTCLRRRETDRVCHSIDAGEARPILKPSRRLPLEKQAEVASCSWNLQRRLIPKSHTVPGQLLSFSSGRKNENLCFYVGYRKPNGVENKHRFSLHKTEDILDTLAGAKWSCNMDLISGYWQMALHAHKEETASSTGQGLYKFKVMPFGVCKLQRRFRGYGKPS
jgi:hypothetical protein